jgi:hypothetical protein
LLVANPGRDLFVSRCNSGSARHQKGHRVKRGPATFRCLSEALFPASSVVELSFLEGVRLPADSEFSTALEGPWRRLRPVS